MRSVFGVFSSGALGVYVCLGTLGKILAVGGDHIGAVATAAQYDIRRIFGSWCIGHEFISMPFKRKVDAKLCLTFIGGIRTDITGNRPLTELLGTPIYLEDFL